MSLFRVSFSTALLALVAACGGSGTTPPPPGPTAIELFEDRLDREDAMNDRISGYAGTAFDAIPDTGSATFRGMGTATIDRDDSTRSDDINLVGFVRLDADFRDQELSGAMSEIQGYTGRNPSASKLFDANGRIVIGGRSSELERTNSGATNRWSADYRGTLGTPEGRIVMDGELEGRFRGTQLSNGGRDADIRAIMGSDSGGNATVGGRNADGMNLDVMGLNDALN